MDTLTYLLNKFNFKQEDFDNGNLPLEIPNIGRNQLASLFAELNFTDGAEIGVEQGEYSEVLCQANPLLKLYCVDSWKAYRGYRDHTRQEKLDNFYDTAKFRLDGYNCEIIKGFSMDVVKDFKDESLDFVYLDANHNFLHFSQDLYYWSRKVRRGGIVSGHDYIKRQEPTDTHVYQVLEAYTDAYHIRPWFVLGTQAKIEGEIRDDVRSWMYVKA